MEEGFFKGVRLCKGTGGWWEDLLDKRPKWWDQCSDRTSGHEDIFPSHPPKPSMALMSNTDKEKRS